MTVSGSELVRILVYFSYIYSMYYDCKFKLITCSLGGEGSPAQLELLMTE